MAVAAVTECWPSKEEKTAKNYKKKHMHISFSYAKILEETNFQLREFPQSGSKAKDVEEERKLVITMASYALQKPPRVAY